VQVGCLRPDRHFVRALAAGTRETSAMTAMPKAAPSAAPASRPLLVVLRALFLAEAVGGLVLAIFLSLLAGATADGDTETSLRFAAGAAFVFGIFAAVASRGVRRRRSWAWTLGAVLQVILAIGTGLAVFIGSWHPAYLIGFAFAAVVMIVLSTASVRRALGQD
jgi:hypothetical protein